MIRDFRIAIDLFLGTKVPKLILQLPYPRLKSRGNLKPWQAKLMHKQLKKMLEKFHEAN